MIRVTHDIPGRLRLAAPTLREAPREAVALRRRLRQIEGVTSVTFNPRTGSFLVLYGGAAVRQAILAALERNPPAVHDSRAAGSSGSPPLVQSEIRVGLPRRSAMHRGSTEDALADAIADFAAQRLTTWALRTVIGFLV